MGGAITQRQGERLESGGDDVRVVRTAGLRSRTLSPVWVPRLAHVRAQHHSSGNQADQSAERALLHVGPEFAHSGFMYVAFKQHSGLRHAHGPGLVVAPRAKWLVPEWVSSLYYP